MENPNCRMVFCLSTQVLYAATAAVWTNPLVFELSSAIPLGSDVTPTLTLFNFWTMFWNRLSVARGFQGYWDAPIFFPLKDTFALSDPQSFCGACILFYSSADSRWRLRMQWSNSFCINRKRMCWLLFSQAIGSCGYD